MSFVSILPETLSAAADNLQSAGSRIQAQNTAALGPTTGLAPAAADEVSAMTAMQFAAHAHAYQTVSAQAASIHQMFVTMLAADAGSYAATEAANAVATSEGVSAMDFATLPPEVNSGLMYTGPGSGPMIAAAASWDSLAAEVSSAAGDYGSVISGLTSGPWRGPASASMAAAATPYVSWMNVTAAQAEQAADQAKAAASAYEAAFSATVAPPIIAANRTLLASLIATNILGQNTPAIATTEAHYAEMWAQDAAAMYGYAGSSAAASTLTPLAPPA